MRNLIGIAVLTLTLLAAITFAVERRSDGRQQEIVGFSSEDFTGGDSYLGVDTRDITPDRLGPLGLKEEHGVEVTTVDQDAPAGKAGIKEHDVILSVNGTQVESVEQLRRMIHEIPSGRVVSLGLLRNGQPLSVKAQLVDRRQADGYEYAYGPDSKNFKFAIPAVPPIPPMPEIHIPDIDIPVSVVVHSSLRSGLMVENLTPQLGDYFGAKNGQGVLVRSVEKGSRAEKAGFRAGDVIVKVNGQPVVDAGDFSHALRMRKDNSANVTIIRERKEQTITLTLPDHSQSGMLMGESFEVPELDAETRLAVSQAEDQVAHLQPELAKVAVEMKQMRPAIEKAQREVRQNREVIQKEMREMQKQMRNLKLSTRADI
jgi:membrane-associated protease RseP (regulator of RpoE activity)